MLRSHFVIPGLLLFAAVCSAQQSSEPSSTASCNLEDGRQVYIRYNPVSSKNDKLAQRQALDSRGCPDDPFHRGPAHLRQVR